MWLIITLVSLVIFFLLVFSIPLDLSLRLDVNGRISFQSRLVWLFGLLSKRIGKKERKKKAKQRKVKDKKGGVNRALFFLRIKGLLKQVKVLIKDIFCSLNIRRLETNLVIGLDDPADTGLLFAYIGPASVFFNPSKKYCISIEPSFEDEAILKGYIHAVIRLIPIRVVIPLLKFIFSPPVFRIGRALFVSKWKKK
ncbi:MAG: DUF2953 domain-containing protein [Dehalococcoidia bacterium]|nr:MAG: DUF2953 domain-containing protein [Dehalococcoidia bacterium]